MSQRSYLRESSYSFARICARLIGVLFFRLRCTGREHWPLAGGGLVCANHQSYIDPVIVGLCCDRRMNYLARESLFRFAPFRWLIRWFDAIPIRREGLGLDGLKETMRRVKRGELVLIFPEGTRTRDGSLGTIQPGFCAIARRVKAPLIPVGIQGAYEVWPRDRALPRLSRIRVHIGRPIEPAEMEKLDDEALMGELRRRLLESLQSH